MVTGGDIGACGVTQGLIDDAQRRSIEDVMGRRYATAVSLFLEYTVCRIESMEIALASSLGPDSLLRPAELIQESAAAIGASGLAMLADDIAAAARAGDIAALHDLLAAIRLCFRRTEEYFLCGLSLNLRPRRTVTV